MPRFVRPSWVDIQIDGRSSDIGTGPRRKDGDMSAQFYVREKGYIEPSVSIKSVSNGKINTLEVFDKNGKLIYVHLTELD